MATVGVEIRSDAGSDYLTVRDGNRIERVHKDDKDNQFYKSVITKLSTEMMKGRQVTKVNHTSALRLAITCMLLMAILGHGIDRIRS